MSIIGRDSTLKRHRNLGPYHQELIIQTLNSPGAGNVVQLVLILGWYARSSGFVLWYQVKLGEVAHT